MEIVKFYKEHKNIVFLSIILAIIGIVITGLILIPSLFYDQWIWKYYWGPIIADAEGHSVSHNGIYAQEGYTILSEITYGILLVLTIYLIYKLLLRLNISIDWNFCLALIPYILFGSVLRVLEDTNYFNEPFVYFFITPLIYIQITIYALGFLILGYYLKISSEKKSSRTIIIYIISIIIFIDILYTILWILGLDYGARTINPFVFYVISIVAFTPIFYNFFKEKILKVNNVIFSGGLFFLLMTLYLTGEWMLGEKWSYSSGIRFDFFVLILLLITSMAIAIYFLSIKYKDSNIITIYIRPLNFTMIIGHMIDGISSYISIYDPLNMALPGYIEKHPASNFLMETWPPLFPIVKFILIVIVIYFFDILYKEELKEHIRLVNLLKIGIIILGLSPGLRDLLRVTMGV